MRMSTLLAPTLRDDPSEAEVASHRLMLRAGFMRRVAAGIYIHLPLGNRVIRRIEDIVRQEMDGKGGQEVRLPIVQPASMWRRTGRWDEYGDEMWRLKDRHGREYCLGPTHEEVTTTLAMTEIHSYRSLPVLVYQIQNKYRDEIRPRFGVMRSREFIMKDLYSFDRDEQGLDESYRAMYDAYSRIFERCGLSFRVVEADSGAIGGDATHEFMALADTGEAVVLYCPQCGYAANQERAVAGSEPGAQSENTASPEEVYTPGVRTIEQLAQFLEIPARDTGKILFYRAEGTGEDGGVELVAVLVRGDRQVNDLKVKNHLNCLHLALASAEEVEELTGAPFGSAGPVGLTGARVLADQELASLNSVAVGANRSDWHLTGVVPGRDFPLDEVGDFRLAAAGDKCHSCPGSLKIQRGIEVGQIFKLGTKYSDALSASFTDEDGKQHSLVMGCYGIGITRTMAAIVEQNHDERGIIWPEAVAPYQVIVVPVNADKPQQKDAAERIYSQLGELGVDSVIDDRKESPGVKFGDADLMGFPWRITVGPRSLKTGSCEIKCRATGEEMTVPLDKAASELAARSGQTKGARSQR